MTCNLRNLSAQHKKKILEQKKSQHRLSGRLPESPLVAAAAEANASVAKKNEFEKKTKPNYVFQK